jgi:hypothetical protein
MAELDAHDRAEGARHQLEHHLLQRSARADRESVTHT